MRRLVCWTAATLVILAAIEVAGATATPPTTMKATGEFDVTIRPQTAYDTTSGTPLARMSIDKIFRADLTGSSKGEMLTAMSASVKDSGVYVAVERVTGTLHGQAGTFSLHHTGVMNRGAQRIWRESSAP